MESLSEKWHRRERHGSASPATSDSVLTDRCVQATAALRGVDRRRIASGFSLGIRPRVLLRSTRRSVGRVREILMKQIKK